MRCRAGRPCSSRSSAGSGCSPAKLRGTPKPKTVRQRLHPLTALTAAACTAVITTAASSWVLSITVTAAVALGAVRLGVAGRVLPAAAVILMPLGLSLLMIHGLFFPEGSIVLAEWGPARVTAEGLAFAGESAARTAVPVLVFLLFSFTVSVPDLVTVLTMGRLAPRVGFVLASTLTLLPAIAGRLDRIRQAQEARGLVLRGGLTSRLAATRLQMVPLVLALTSDAASRAQALDARGFGGPGARSSYREVVDSPAQRRFRAATLLAAACMVGFRLVQSLPGLGR
ncbi:energy-coupling factor transporter transmembrane protein EcfT [Arthrobacter sp. PAMC25284]|nr:energy-coupling factor transporter transmembrane protein EcfT [Arthrobacter sp. PAMC25284]